MVRLLRTVTITGIDNNVDIQALIELQQQYRRVEWGVLLSATRQGVDRRYPSLERIEAFKAAGLNLAFHLCGSLVFEFLDGLELPGIIGVDKEVRIQLNARHQLARIDEAQLVKLFSRHRLILQVGDYVPPGFRRLAKSMELLYDKSGGTGQLPERWPQPLDGPAGFAGGLTPDNVVAQLRQIEIALMTAKTSQFTVWIDVESGVRTDDWLDLNKVRHYLTAVAPYVNGGNDLTTLSMLLGRLQNAATDQHDDQEPTDQSPGPPSQR